MHPATALDPSRRRGCASSAAPPVRLRRVLRRVLASAAAVLLAAAIPGAALLVAAPARAGETVTLAAEDDWPPYSSVRANGEPEGFAVDVVREAFATQGITASFVAAPFARCMFLAQEGQVTGCFDATIVDDNRDVYHWHPTPMFREELAIFGRAGGSDHRLGLADLAGRSVGYTLGYTYPTEFQRDPRIRRVSAQSDRVLLEMLQAGRVDYILINTAPAWLRINTTPALKGRFEKAGVISDDGFWIAFTRARPEGERMAEAFERGLAALKQSGRYEAMSAALRRRIGF